jgi:hypothetical protein
MAAGLGNRVSRAADSERNRFHSHFDAVAPSSPEGIFYILNVRCSAIRRSEIF